MTTETTTEMTAEEAAAAAARPIGSVGGRFMSWVPTFRRGTAAGFPKGWYFYAAGRGGVLGDVDADVVAAAFVYFPADWLRDHWETARTVMEPRQAAAEYAAACHEWGREHLTEVEGLDRLAVLLARVADSADPAGAPLFAGWRALPRPDDAAGAVAQLLMVMREHRGGQHAMTVLAEGLTPVEAVVTGGGAGNAKFFNWPTPLPDPEPLRAAYANAEARTTRLAARAYEVLSPDERRELVDLLTRMKATLDA
jgi:hypothetical protein